MLRRVAVVGAPPFLVAVAAFLLIRYYPLVLEGVWGGALPEAWGTVLRHLPLMLAAVGVILGLRMGSFGLMLVMLTLGVAVGAPPPGLIVGFPGAAAQGALPMMVLLVPACYLLALWTLRHSWRTRRAWIALAVVLALAGALVWVMGAGRGTAADLGGWLMEGRGAWRLGPLEVMRPWAEALPPLFVAAILIFVALRTHDPIAAAMAASLMLLLPPISQGLGRIALGILSCGAIGVVLVGALESMFALAYRDGLTGLPGRRGLNEALRQLGGRYAIAMLDVDHFKRFNDRFGHRAGDDVLKMIAARMLRIRGGRAFRYGGEEFAVIFKGRAARQAGDRLEPFRADLSRAPFVIRRLPRSSKKSRGGLTARIRIRQQVRITVSIGWATPSPGCRKPAEVLAAADKALYKAKQKGRNRVVAAGTRANRTPG